MCNGIRLHGSADIISFTVGYYKQAFFLCVSYRVIKCFYSLPPIHFIIGALRLYGRHNIAKRIYKPFVKCQKRICRSLKRISVFLTRVFFDKLGNVVKLRVKPCHSRIFLFVNCTDKSVKSHLSIS